MTSPLPSSSLAALERLATGSIAYNATWHSVAELLDDGFSGPDAEFIAACSPDVILSLLSLASSGAADGARLRAMLEKSTVRLGILRDRMEGCHDGKPFRDQLHHLSLEEAAAWIEEQSAAARSLPPSAPSDDTAQQEQDLDKTANGQQLAPLTRRRDQ